MTAVVVVLAVLLLTIGAIAGAAAYLLWRLRRRNRVVPTVATMAPLLWLVALTGPARLHRRLRSAIEVAHLARGLPGADSVLRDLEAHAATVDGHLVVAARLRTGRVAAFRALNAQTDGIEHVARRLATAAVEARRMPALPGEAADPLARIGEKLDALEAARRDLAHLERSAGLERLPGLVTPPPTSLPG